MFTSSFLSTKPFTGLSAKKAILIVITLLLLLIAASRITQLTRLNFYQDEVWTIFQSYGTPAQIINWTPFDWGPLHYLLIGIWRLGVGIQPIPMRYSSVLFSLITAALLYRVGKRLAGNTAGILITLAYASFARTIAQSTVVRGYTMMAALAVLAFWLTLRYFYIPEFNRKTLIRGVWLTIVLVALFYTQLTSVVFFGMLGLFMLALYPKKILWWIPPVAVGTILCVPQILRLPILFRTVNTSGTNQPLVLLSLPEKIIRLFATYTGYTFAIWSVVVIVATLALIYWLYQHKNWGLISGIILWLLLPVWIALLPPLARRVTDYATGTYVPNYQWPLLIAIALWVGVGIAILPSVTKWLAALTFIGMLFVPVPLDYWIVPQQPMLDNFEFLSKHLQAADVVFIDPKIEVEPFVWDYFKQVYFPQGLQIVTNPSGYRRVWYLSKDGIRDNQAYQTVLDHRLKREFVGPWDFLLQLYEGPPDFNGIPFENGMRFHGAEIISTQDTTVHDGDSVTLRLWWSVDRQVPLDYSVGLYLTNVKTGDVVAQNDSPPNLTTDPRETSRWVTGRYYVEDRILTVPDLGYGLHYMVNMAVYYWQDQKRVAAPGGDANTLLPVQSVYVKSWRLP